MCEAFSDSSRIGNKRAESKNPPACKHYNTDEFDAGDVMAKVDLSASGARLVELMQCINFGRIEHLAVRSGAPVVDPPPRVVREIKFRGENGPRPEMAKDDFALKAQVRELFAQLEAMGDGTVRCIEVKHGLPFKMTVEEVIA